MRTIVSPILAIALTASSAFAADSTGPLPAGKPAGVRQADLAGDTGLILLGVAVVAAGIAIAATSGGGSGPGSSTTTNVTTTTTTA